MIAKELKAKHKLKQTDIAKLLGVSQPAVSLYYRKIRGRTINLESDPDIRKLIENFASSLAGHGLTHKDFIPMFCEICRTIRAKGLLCKMHKVFDPSIDIEKCELCSMINSTKCM